VDLRVLAARSDSTKSPSRSGGSCVNHAQVNDGGNVGGLQVPGVGNVFFGCSASGATPVSPYFLQFLARPPGDTGSTRVWFDDTIAGMSLVTLTDTNDVVRFTGVTGTRHVVVHATNATRSATWNVFYEGAAAGSPCRISAEGPAAASLSTTSVQRRVLGRPAVRPAVRGRKGR